MMKDEAERIAAHIARTISQEVASVIGVDCCAREDENAWGVQCSEHLLVDGLDIQIWIGTVQNWIRHQRFWCILMKHLPS
ncbi:MAG TPA: hypothetical protein VKR06_41790 [Ktedonosporobacter sp.]|nr:hypothetical protein [Ktedonosporobacter sp.]